jgi:two-component system cell cycle response regulator DivK
MSQKILYIEDNADNRMLVRRVLEVEGYEVVEAEDGKEGIRLAQSIQPDLILLDINLPDIDGYEVTRRLRDIPHIAKIPILAMTANVMRGDREKTLEAGCDHYIQKPIDIDLLPRQIAEYL